MEQARLVFSLELMRRKTALETEKKIRGDFIDELLSGLPLSKQVIINKGSQLGFNSEVDWEIAVIESDSESISLFIDKVTVLIHQESQKLRVKSHVHRQGDKYILLLASKSLDADPKHQSNLSFCWNEILIPFMNDWKGIRLGLGGKTQLWNINRSYLEAKKALMIGARMNLNPRENLISASKSGNAAEVQLVVDFTKIPANVHRIGITVTIHDADQRMQNFGQVSNAFVRLVDDSNNQELLRFIFCHSGFYWNLFEFMVN